MFDDLECLRNDPHLLELFRHYARLGELNRELWQTRRAQMEGVEPSALTKLHGELLASDWIESNIGQTPCCYRITLAGLRAFRQVESTEEDILPHRAEAGHQAA